MISESATILIVEDEQDIRELLAYNLEKEGYATVQAADGKEGLELARSRKPDLILLDLMLPKMDGLAVCRELERDSGTVRIPIIMLTAKGTEYDKVLGLDAGADDYIAKPFGMMELIARVKALLRRAEVVDTDRDYTIGQLFVSPSKHVVRACGDDVTLTLKEFEMLTLLVENQGIVFTRDQLLTKIWGYAFDGESRTVDVHIRSLRQKLGACGGLIETVRGIGYKIGEDKYEKPNI